MSDDKTPIIKKRRLLSLILLLVAFALLVFTVIFLIFGIGSCSSPLAGLFSSRAPIITVNEFNFDVGRNRMFAHSNGSVAAVGTLGLQVLDTDGRETLRDSFRMASPAIAGSGGRFIAFDIGGSAVRVFNATQVSSSIDTDGTIVSASLNPNGWFCVVTQEGGGLRGAIAVYNSLGLETYRVNLGSGFALSAELSSDNSSLAILNYTEAGSRITFYDTEKSEPDHVFDLSGELILDIISLSNKNTLAVTTDSIILVDNSGEGKSIYTFSDRRLGSFAYADDFLALHLYDHGIGFRGRLITLLSDGTVLGEISTDREVVSMSVVDKTIAVLKSDGLLFYDETLTEFPTSAESISAAGANRVVAISENYALATSDNSAVILTRDYYSHLEQN